MSEVKLCKDCRMFDANNAPVPWTVVGDMAERVPMCMHPRQPRNPVDGGVLMTCAQARGRFNESYDNERPWRENLCGPSGALWEARDEGEK